MITNKEEWRLVGLSRSGNHAVINWLLGQIEGDYCFLNCAEPKTNPFDTCRPFNAEGDRLETNINHFNIYDETAGNHSSKEYLMYSYEDCFLGTLNHSTFIKNRIRWTGKSGKKRDVLIVRDAFNLFASRIRSGLLLGHETHHGVKGISIHALKTMYKQHLREFLGSRDNLKGKVCISYNQWVKDKDYRCLIADRLDLNFNDSGIYRVSECAGGSSFDGRGFLREPHNMKVEDRWKHYIDSEEYWSLFDDEIADYVYKAFGDMEPLKYYRNNTTSFSQNFTDYRIKF